MTASNIRPRKRSFMALLNNFGSSVGSVGAGRDGRIKKEQRMAGGRGGGGVVS